MHEDIYNEEKQGEASKYKIIIEEIETRKAKGATIRSRVKWQKWQKVGGKCSAESLKSIGQNNSQTVILELRDSHGRSFTKRRF